MPAQMNRVAVVELENATALDALWRQIQRHLEDEKEQIFQEIRSYPPPIPACDAQFNGLLEKRAAILQALGQVKGIRNQRLPGRDQVESLDELMVSAKLLSGELAEQLRRTVAQLLP